MKKIEIECSPTFRNEIQLEKLILNVYQLPRFSCHDVDERTRGYKYIYTKIMHIDTRDVD